MFIINYLLLSNVERLRAYVPISTRIYNVNAGGAAVGTTSVEPATSPLRRRPHGRHHELWKRYDDGETSLKNILGDASRVHSPAAEQRLVTNLKLFNNLSTFRIIADVA